MHSDYKQRLIALTAGAALGFLACSLAGHFIPEKLENFTRLHIFISPDSMYYPTVRSVFNMAQAAASRDKPIVIVGGSSVMYGAGQPPGKTIAEVLRAELGSDYAVLNLALRGGDVAGIGLFVAEALQAAGYSVFYMADVFFAGLDPMGSEAYYHYLYWQYRFEPIARPWRPRDDYAQRLILTDVAVGQRLNSIFRFNNLWNEIGYRWFFTVYSKFVHDKFWQPRQELRDPEVERPAQLFFEHANMGLELRDLGLTVTTPTDLTDQKWAEIKETWYATILPTMRDRTLFLLCKKNPRVTEQLSKEEQARLVELYDFAERRYREAGLHPLSPCKDFVADDYADTTHLSVQGAQKMAREISKAIQQIKGKLP